MLKKLRLGTQFTLLLTLIFLGGIILSGITLLQAMQRKAEDEITTKAAILTQTMDAVRTYTSDHIAPLLQDQLETTPTFISEVVPAFSARQVFENFRDQPEYRNFFYKETTLNPTNPRDKADEFETKLVEQFRNQPDLAKLSGYRNVIGIKQFFTARPSLIKEASCLQCHSRPSVAPESQIASYGAENGFGWKLNEIVAAQTIYVPSDEVFARGNQYLALMMGIFVSIFAAVALLINWLLKRRVIRPIKQLTKIAQNMTMGTMTAEQANEFNAPNIVKVATDLRIPNLITDVQKIHGAGQHLLGLINNILDLSKVEAGKMELFLETFAIAPLIHEVAATLRPCPASPPKALVESLLKRIKPRSRGGKK